MIEVKYRWDATGLFAKLDLLEKKALPFAYSTMRLIAQDALEVIKEKTPGKGTIRELWSIFEERHESIMEYIIRNSYENSDILWYLELGTSPHLIFPRRASVLAWEDPGAPKGVRYAKKVVHPGTRPYGMVKAAYDIIDTIADKYIKELFDNLEIEMEKAATRNRGELV